MPVEVQASKIGLYIEDYYRSINRGHSPRSTQLPRPTELGHWGREQRHGVSTWKFVSGCCKW